MATSRVPSDTHNFAAQAYTIIKLEVPRVCPEIVDVLREGEVVGMIQRKAKVGEGGYLFGADKVGVFIATVPARKGASVILLAKVYL